MDFFYPPTLPISGSIDLLRETIRDHQVVIVAGETGSGKTTQLPKLCLELFLEEKGLIGCTQPRRIAATSVAERVAEELGAQAPLVGSKIRFSDRTSARTRIKFMTDGVLLAESRNDPDLARYRVIIVDEAHERNLNIDFLLGYLHRLLGRRKELKLIITSATIDTEAFSAHFGQAPVVAIEGRGHPVDITYLPAADDDEEITHVDHCLEVVADLCQSKPLGDILVFLPTEKDIRSCCTALKGRIQSHLVLPLFGRLPSKDQRLIFHPHPRPKIVVATNVAESSITVPGIRYVVDSGLARIGAYHPRSRTMRLPVDRISRASCDQRAGRSGRIGPGVCIRLFSEEDYLLRPPFSVPEIQRANLAEVILQMISLNLGDPTRFPFLDPPRRAAVNEGFRTLRELGAITPANRLTPFGKIMASLPIDPVISRIVIEASRNNCLTETLIIAAALAIQDPRMRPAESENLADQAHRAFADHNSDFMALLNIWNGYHHTHPRFSWSGLKRFCQANYLSFQRMREWLDLHEQLQRLVSNNRTFRFNNTPASYEAVHRSLLAGLFRHCARRVKASVYQGLGNHEVRIFPGSYLYHRGRDWIVAGSFIETSRLYALSAAAIEAEWLEQSAAPFCSYSWSNIRFHQKTGWVMADESVSLGGLVLVSGRPVNYPRRDDRNIPKAREIFIQAALAEARLNPAPEFLRGNSDLLHSWRENEEKLRRRDIVIDDAALYDFYDRALPTLVYDRTTLLAHIGDHGDAGLRLGESDILRQRLDPSGLLDFPAFLPGTDGQVALRYHFEPGTEEDGVTALLPEELIDTIDPDLFDWLVPGLIVEKTTYLLKGLPKRLRKRLIPIQETALLVLDAVDSQRGSFLRQLTAAIATRRQVTVLPEDWPADLPPHLVMHCRVIDRTGAVLMKSRDYRELLGRFRGVTGGGAPLIMPEHQRLLDGLAGKFFQHWEFDDYPERIPVMLPGGRVGGYLFAGLEAAPDRQAVALRYFKSRDEAVRVGQRGFRYLIRLHGKARFKELQHHCRISLSGPSSIWLAAHCGGAARSTDAILDLVVASQTAELGQAEFSGAWFTAAVERIDKGDLLEQGRRLIDQILAVLRQRKETAELIGRYENLSKSKGVFDQELFEDLRGQLEAIVPADFLDHFADRDLMDCGRHLKSLAIRCERAYHDPRKDLDKRVKLRAHERNLHSCRERLPLLDTDCRASYEAYRKIVAEWRISLFSPEMRTLVPVSEQKVARAWQEFTSAC